jgi:hypothetical protein
MKRSLTLLFVVFAAAGGAQQAAFTFDSLAGKQYAGSQINKIRLWQWQINGQLLTWTSGPVYVKPDPRKLDTILFRKTPEQKWDTFLCNVTRPLSYNFAYNSCCGGFNIMILGKPKGTSFGVVFTVNGKGKDLLGTISESGMFLKPGINDTLRPLCRSAMAPNIYSITIQETDRNDSAAFTDSLDCMKGGLLHPDTEYGYRYKRLSSPVRFNYIPLGSVLHVLYDTRLKKVRIY